MASSRELNRDVRFTICDSHIYDADINHGGGEIEICIGNHTVYAPIEDIVDLGDCEIGSVDISCSYGDIIDTVPDFEDFAAFVMAFAAEEGVNLPGADGDVSDKLLKITGCDYISEALDAVAKNAAIVNTIRAILL